MKRVIFGALAIILVACGGEEPTQDNQQSEGSETARFDSVGVDSVEVIEDTIVIDTLPEPIDYTAYLNAPQYFMVEEISILKNYFTDSLIWAYDHCIVTLEEADTDTAFLKAYTGALELKLALSMHIQELNLFNENREGSYYPDFVINDLAPVDNQTMGFFGTCVAECTEFDFTFSLTDFENKAASTMGEMDDIFITLLSSADGEYGGDAMGWMTWFARMWDYGGAVQMGTGRIESFLKSSKAFMEAHDMANTFPKINDLLLQYRRNALGDITHGIYMQSAELVSGELDRIIEEHLFENELEKMVNWNNKIKAGDYQCECVGGSMQFDCETGDCDFGG